MFVFDEPILSFIVGLILAVISFTFQLILCLRTSKNSSNLIPINLLIPCAIVCLSLYFGIFVNGSVGFLSNIKRVIAAVFTEVVGFACLGELGAWWIYAKRKKKYFHN